MGNIKFENLVYKLDILLACKELIADAKIGCTDLVFKDVCIDVLAKARLVLSAEEFEKLRFFAVEQIRDEKVTRSGRKIKIK